MRRRCVLIGAAAASLAAPAVALLFPSKPVRLVVPYAPGGGADDDGPPDRAQAAGRARPDRGDRQEDGRRWNDRRRCRRQGGTRRPHAADRRLRACRQPSLMAKMPFRTPDDFAPISLLVTVPELLVVTPTFPAKTVAELVAMAKAEPGKLSYASSGNGTAQHLAAELVQDAHRHRHPGCAVQGRQPGRGRRRRRPRAVLLRQHELGAASGTREPRAGRSPSPVRSSRRLGRRFRPWPRPASPAATMSEWNALLAPPARRRRSSSDSMPRCAKVLATDEIKAKCADLGAQPFGSSGGARPAVELPVGSVRKVWRWVRPRRLAAGPGPGSVFYAATGTYSATYTCNTWTAEGLRVGGIPVTPAGVVFVSELTDQLRSFGAR